MYYSPVPFFLTLLGLPVHNDVHKVYAGLKSSDKRGFIIMEDLGDQAG